jgi:hypothetical protein
MDLIILIDGFYHLVPVTKAMLADLKLFNETIDCFDLCEILRIKLSTYTEFTNTHMMNDDSGDFFGCICR